MQVDRRSLSPARSQEEDEGMADDEATEAAETAQAKRAGRLWLVIAGAIVAILVVAGGVWALVARDDDSPAYDTAQIGWMHQGCQQWADSYQGSNGPNTGWCTSMTDWMNHRMDPNPSSGNGMMAGSMMWQDPASMQATCEQWMSTNSNGGASGTDTTGWCTQMVDWMDQHMGGWDTWMRNGPMMDGS